jgi:hypothetical protein
METINTTTTTTTATIATIATTDIITTTTSTTTTTTALLEQGDASVSTPLSTPLSSTQYQTADEAEEAFCALLFEKAVDSKMDWREAMPLIVNDRRYAALRSLQAHAACLSAPFSCSPLSSPLLISLALFSISL